MTNYRCVHDVVEPDINNDQPLKIFVAGKTYEMVRESSDYVTLKTEFGNCKEFRRNFLFLGGFKRIC